MKKIITILVLTTLFVINCGKKEFFVDTKKSGSDVSNFTLVDFDSKKIESDNIIKNGKETLLLIVAEWCPHCKKEMPDIEKFYNEYKENVNIIVVFTNSNSSLDAAKDYYTSNGYTFKAYYDDDGSITRGFNVQGFPFNVKLDKNGKVEKELDLPVTYDSLINNFSK